MKTPKITLATSENLGHGTSRRLGTKKSQDPHTLLELMMQIGLDEPGISRADMKVHVRNEATDSMLHEASDFYVDLKYTEIFPPPPKPELTPEEKEAAEKARQKRKQNNEAAFDAGIVELMLAKLAGDGKRWIDRTNAQMEGFFRKQKRTMGALADRCAKVFHKKNGARNAKVSISQEEFRRLISKG
jgi:hypothetical protein